MKTIRLFFALVLFCTTSVAFATENPQQVVYIGIDLTGSTSYDSLPSAKTILSKVVQDESESVEVFVSEINDVSLTAVSHFSLSQQKRFTNPLTRQDEVNAFYNAVDTELTTVASRPNSKAESSIYLNLCTALETFSRTGTEKKTILLFTDFIENSSLTTSFYSLYKSSQNLLTQYNSIVTDFEKAEPFPELSGIEIIVVYTPTLGTDGMFHESRKFWKKFIQERGGTVRFTATL